MQATSNMRRSYRKHWNRRRHLADPNEDIIWLAVLMVMLLLTGFMHFPISL